MTYHAPNPEHGWGQPQPGRPPLVPRAARQPSPSGLLWTVVLLLWFSPLSLLTMVAGHAAIGRASCRERVSSVV